MEAGNPKHTQLTRPGTLFIISAPSGTGKTTLVHALLERMPELVVSISHTTRPKRPAERDGDSYYFIDDPAFMRMLEEQAFLEHATVFDYRYGTSRTFVEDHLVAGNDVLLEIDWQGARQVKRQRPDAVCLFILPPSYRILEQRLKTRGETHATVRRRMDAACVELSHYDEYDYLVINDDLHFAVTEMESIIEAARNQYRLHKPYFDWFIKQLMEEASIIQ